MNPEEEVFPTLSAYMILILIKILAERHGYNLLSLFRMSS